MTKKETLFVATVFDFYNKHGRHTLPWRQTHDPYHILVSELMLQQTQVERVIPKYRAFIERWPSTKALAAANLKDVLLAWQGLGYNRRAKYLLAAAQHIEVELKGVFPRVEEALQTLPGVGSYTASAITAFAYNKPTIMIETNIRTVYLHHFFKNVSLVTDKEILSYIIRTLPSTDSGTWYAALMDYGSHLKSTVGNVSRRSSSYTKQSTFIGSRRQLRGAIIRYLNLKLATKQQMLRNFPGRTNEEIESVLGDLEGEGLIQKRGRHYQLPT